MVAGKDPKSIVAGLGLSYLAEGDKAFKTAWSCIPEISKSGKIQHVMYGERDGVEMTGFQYTMVMHTGQAPIVVNKAVYSCEIPAVPRTVIRRMAFFTRFFRWLGLVKSISTGDSRFDRVFRIDSADESFARSLLSDRLRAHILDKATVTWRLQDGRLILIYAGRMRASRVGASMSPRSTLPLAVLPS